LNKMLITLSAERLSAQAAAAFTTSFQGIR
jgi:hypothetical protein